MDIALIRKNLTPEVRRALEGAARLPVRHGVRVRRTADGYELIVDAASAKATGAAKAPQRKGPVRLGLMNHLGLKLED